MFGDIIEPTHLLFILVVALLVLGPKRLPEVGKSLGSGLRDFRSTLSGEQPPSTQSPQQQPRPTPEYVHAPPQEPLARIKAPVEPEPGSIELAPIDAAVVERPAPPRTSDPLA